MYQKLEELLGKSCDQQDGFNKFELYFGKHPDIFIKSPEAGKILEGVVEEYWTFVRIRFKSLPSTTALLPEKVTRRRMQVEFPLVMKISSSEGSSYFFILVDSYDICDDSVPVPLREFKRFLREIYHIEISYVLIAYNLENRMVNYFYYDIEREIHWSHEANLEKARG